MQSRRYFRGVGGLAWIFLFLLLALVPAQSNLASEAKLLDSKGPTYLGHHLEYFKDPSGELTLDEVRQRAQRGEFEAANAVSPNFGYRSGAVWTRVVLTRDSAHADDWMMELNHPLFRNIDAYVLQPDGHQEGYRGGHAVPMGEWPFENRVFVFPLQLTADQETEVWLRVAGDSALQIPLRIWERDHFVEGNWVSMLGFGLIYGIMLALFAYNLVLYLSIRDRIYLLYVAYVASMAVALATVNGLSTLYLWPSGTNWAHIAAPTLGAFAHIAMVLFARAFLQIPQSMPRVDRYLLWPIMGILVVLTLLPVTGQVQLANQLLMPFLLVIVLVTLSLGAIRWWQGLAQARYFLIAWGLLLLGVALYALRALGVVPNIFVTEYGVVVGAAAELLLLSFALAHRIRILEDEKDQIQKSAEAYLEQKANEDEVTGLPNRRAFHAYLEQCAERARDGHAHALILLQPERFRLLLAGRGYEAGDEILRMLAERLAELRRILGERHDLELILGRFIGPMFAFIVPDCSRERRKALLEDLAEELRVPVNRDGREYQFTFDIVSAMAPEDGESPEELIRNTESAFVHCGQDGQPVCFNRRMGLQAEYQLSIEEDLRVAAKRGELHLVYQPQVNIRDGKVVGLEALLRWNRKGEPVSPGEFIPIAEQAGLIAEIGRWVLREVAAQIRTWREEGVAVPRVAVNISAHQFARTDFVEEVQEITEKGGVQPQDLELEITETAAMQELDGTLERLNALRELGFFIAIDDFGTGHSSMAYLERFPVQKLKIDRRFIRNLDASGPEAAIPQRILDLGCSMELICIAEGVEQWSQVEALRENGCLIVQGFYFARPMSSDEVPAVIRRGYGEKLVDG